MSAGSNRGSLEKTMTGHADDQDTRMAGLPDFDQMLVTSFHSAPDHIKRAICTLLKIEMVEGEAQAQVSSEGKHKHAPESDEESKVKKARTSELPSRAESINFRSITSPEVPIHCIIQVDDEPPDGSLDTRDASYGIRAHLDGEIKDEEEHAGAADRSAEESEAEDDAVESRPARPACGMFSGTSAAGDEVARADTGYSMRGGDEEDEWWNGDEDSAPAPPSRGLFSMLDSEAVETPPYWLDFKEDDDEEEEQ